MPLVDFISQTYESISKNVSSKRTLNLYPESTEGEGKSNVILIGCPGTTETADFEYVAGNTETITTPAVISNSFIGNGIDSSVGLSPLLSVPNHIAISLNYKHTDDSLGNHPFQQFGDGLVGSDRFAVLYRREGDKLALYVNNSNTSTAWVCSPSFTIGEVYEIDLVYTIGATPIMYVNNIPLSVTPFYTNTPQTPITPLPIKNTLGLGVISEVLKGELSELYWSTNPLAIDRDSIIQYATGEEHFEKGAPYCIESTNGGMCETDLVIQPNYTPLTIDKFFGFSVKIFTDDLTTNKPYFYCGGDTYENKVLEVYLDTSGNINLSIKMGVNHKSSVSNQSYTSLIVGKWVHFFGYIDLSNPYNLPNLWIDGVPVPLLPINNQIITTFVSSNYDTIVARGSKLADFYVSINANFANQMNAYKHLPILDESNRLYYSIKEGFSGQNSDIASSDWGDNVTQDSLNWVGGAVQGEIIVTPEQTQTIVTQSTGISGVSATSVCRGMYYASNNTLYVVYGGALIKYLPNGLSVKVLSLAENSGTRVSMADNGIHLALVDGAFLKIIRLEDNIVSTPTVDFTNPTEVVFLGRRLVVINESNKFWWCGIDDATTWSALNVASAETNPDDILAMAVKDGELWLMGDRSYEVRRVDSDPNNPYSLVGGSANQIGVGAKYSLSSIADNVFWLGSSVAGQNQVFMSNGYSEQRISTHAIEWELDQYKANTSSAFGFSYQQEGHTFYILTIPQADKTFAYDLATGMWHERSTRDALKNIFHKWAVTHCAFAYGRILCGNGEVPKLLELSLDKYDEWDGRPIVKLHQSPVYFTDGRILYHDRFYLDIETGVGLQLGQGSNPQVMMQYSDDGGHTWSSERWTTLGKIGTYKTRVVWRNNGRTRQRVYRVLVSDPVKVIMIGAGLDYSVGLNR